MIHDMPDSSAHLDKKLNWLRAAVLGANDGIVSVAGVVMGVAGAGAKLPAVMLAGIAALIAGAISMAGGEYTSVSAQRDTELAHGRTSSSVTANPWSAAFSSFVSFTAGALLPLLAISGPWQQYRELATALSVIAALAITGWWAAKVGKAPRLRSILRNVVVSVLTMSLAYLAGAVLGVTILA
jgi:VIT1/CCC1 family predicted Fe2+/Mn2+ transporter